MLWTALYVLIGLAEWIGLVAIPGRSNPYETGDRYFIAISATALLLGFADPVYRHLRVGIWLMAAVLVIALPTGPVGDDDGLSSLWPLVLSPLVLVTAGLHWLGSAPRNPHQAWEQLKAFLRRFN
jgi:hypothetical protein